ncbi:uncharacterized protein LOC125545228 [Triticum urartu]|uniref:uncharacterized protein LOC125545228 n=1 Tax=Triticum urartu TaxID=4572 RepID=UPI00204303FF|nr:uncharacterized protein LOC125545228 [Triticum urartu]
MVPLCTGLFINPCIACIKPPPRQSPSQAAGAQDSPAPRRRSESCLLRRPRAALRCCFPCDPRALPPLLRCRRTTASLVRTCSASRTVPIRCPKAKQPACPAPASPDHRCAGALRSPRCRRASSGPRSRGHRTLLPAFLLCSFLPDKSLSLSFFKCTGSALPSLLFAGAPVPRIRRGAVVPSSSRILALSVQLRRCLPSTPLLDPLLQDRDDERCRRALTRAWVASSMPRPSAPLLQPPFQSGQGPWFR